MTLYLFQNHARVGKKFRNAQFWHELLKVATSYQKSCYCNVFSLLPPPCHWVPLCASLFALLLASRASTSPSRVTRSRTRCPACPRRTSRCRRWRWRSHISTPAPSTRRGPARSSARRRPSSPCNEGEPPAGWGCSGHCVGTLLQLAPHKKKPKKNPLKLTEGVYYWGACLRWSEILFENLSAPVQNPRVVAVYDIIWNWVGHDMVLRRLLTKMWKIFIFIL